MASAVSPTVTTAAAEPVDLIVGGDWVITMDASRTMIRGGGVAIRGGCIVDTGPLDVVRQRWAAAEEVGGAGCVVIPGLVNAHQHLTGDRLARSTIPDSIESGAAIFDWAVPLHAAHRAADDELSATCALVEAVGNGITFTVEAGTVGHPERVLAAYDAVGVGGTLGSWGSDTPGLPWSGPVNDVLARQRHVLELTAGHERVRGWVTLVGHDLMSDELVVAASDLARHEATNLTFHLSPSDSDGVAYAARSALRPVVHLDRLGALGRHVLIAHGVHLDDLELDVLLRDEVALAYCPWAYLRLGQGVTSAGRHAEFLERGGRLALGCDAENAGDAVDILRAAALAAGLAKDGNRMAARFGAHTALELATITGARAIGMGDEIGSLEVGKRADVVVLDATGPASTPGAPDPVLGMIWGSDGRAVTDVVASGRIVVADRRCVTVDVADLRQQADAAQARLLHDAGLAPRPLWPVLDGSE